MRDNVSEIDSTACNVLSRSDTLYSYKNGYRKTYVFNGGRWYYSGSAQYVQGPDSTACIDVANLSSYAAFEPFLYAISGLMVFIVCWLFFRTIKRFVRWS